MYNTITRFCTIDELSDSAGSMQLVSKVNGVWRALDAHASFKESASVMPKEPARCAIVRVMTIIVMQQLGRARA